MRERLGGGRIALILCAAVAAAALVVSPAIGGLGVISPKQVNRLYLKKKSAGRIYLAKADAEARFLTKAEAESRYAPKGEAYPRAESDALYLRPEGTIELTAGPSSWALGPNIFEGPIPTVTHFLDATKLQSEAEVLATAQVTPVLPTVLYGRQTKIAAAELCYDAASNAQLQSVSMQLLEESTEIGAPPPIEELVLDATARTDNACRTYRPERPTLIGGDRMLSLAVVINFNSKAKASFLIGRTSFTLLP